MTPLGFVLLTHQRPHQTERLVRRLNALFGEPPIVCHHDFGQCDLDVGRFPGNVRFVRPHLATAWGRHSLVEATLAGLRLLAESADAPEWVTLLSGADYPVAPASVILSDLAAAGVDAFLEAEIVGAEKADNPWHAEYARRYLHSGPYLPFSDAFRVYSGSQWFTINRRCVRRVLDWYDREVAAGISHRDVPITDESYFLCILCNDPAVAYVCDNKRYVDWSSGNPKVLDRGDLVSLLASGCHFARKLDLDNNPDLFDALDEAIG